MPVETATTIDDLDPSLPSVSDPLTEGDDHIRLIKQVLQNTFTGFENENAGDLTARFEAIEARLDALEAALLLKQDANGGNLVVTSLTADTLTLAASATITGALAVGDINCAALTATGTVSTPTVDADVVTSAGNVTGFDGS